MRLSRRGQVIACVAIVAGLLLLVAVRFFVAPKSPEAEAVAAVEPSSRDTMLPRQADSEPATQLVAPVVSQSARPIPTKRRGQTLTGRVYDEATSAGIAAAVLSYRDMQVGRYDGNWRSRPQITTNADGAFKLDDVPPGRAVIDVAKPGYASREVYVGVAAGRNPPLEIALSAGAAIAGRLTASDGVTPVMGSVALANLEEGAAVTMKTGAGGEFSYTALTPGSYRLTGHGNSGFVQRDISLAVGERIDDLVLALHAGGTVRGTITGLSAQDLAHTTISFVRAEQGGSLLTTRLDERGNYVMTGLPDGRLGVSVDTKRRRQERLIDLPAAGDVTVDFDFPRGMRLSGRVMRQGKPLAKTTIHQRNSSVPGIYLQPVQTSADGEYAFEDIPDGDYYFAVGSYFAPPVRVAGDTVFDFDVPSLTLSGTVVEATRREPIAWASVFVAPASPGQAARSRRIETDAYGKFVFDTSGPGDYIVTFYKPGYELIRKRITVGAADADVSVALSEDEGIRIRLRSTDGAPIRMVFLAESSGELLLRGFTLRLDERGEGQLPRAFVGSKLQFVRDDFAPLVIPRWNGEALDLRLAPAGAR